MYKNSTYKYCIVPCCTNTTKSSEKLFFHVPKDPVRRQAWIKAMKRDEKLSPKLSYISTLWCCEDHFSLPDDMENYWQWKLTKDVRRLQLKTTVIPHIFNCQKKHVPVERSAAKKRKNMHLVQEAIASGSDNTNQQNMSDFDSQFLSDRDAPSTSSSGIFNIGQKEIKTVETRDKATQVDLKKILTVRSKSTNTNVGMVSIGCQTVNTGVSIAVGTTPEKCCEEAMLDFSDDDFEPESSDYDTSDAERTTDNYSSEDEDTTNSNFKEHMIKGTVMSIEREPKLYLGVPKESMFLITLLSEHAKLPANHIYLVLKKIRLNLPFSILAIDFGISSSTACRIFSKSLPVLANLMQDLIWWPDAKHIQAHLPIPFRARYNHVVSIIDCLEIQIEKPSNPLFQALTWSTYYNCNTIKYLISCAPDGLVNFVSDGFGGRASDVIMVEQSGYLNNLHSGAWVMADRGFKNVSTVLHRRNCTLIRPPSVSANTKSSRQEVKQSKRIAALRIHVERLIRRVREFKILCPHACVDRSHIGILDYAVIIACGIINMQDLLIK